MSLNLFFNEETSGRLPLALDTWFLLPQLNSLGFFNEKFKEDVKDSCLKQL